MLNGTILNTRRSHLPGFNRDTSNYRRDMQLCAKTQPTNLHHFVPVVAVSSSTILLADPLLSLCTGRAISACARAAARRNKIIVLEPDKISGIHKNTESTNNALNCFLRHTAQHNQIHLPADRARKIHVCTSSC
jgi:hypothetical protein